MKFQLGIEFFNVFTTRTSPCPTSTRPTRGPAVASTGLTRSPCSIPREVDFSRRALSDGSAPPRRGAAPEPDCACRRQPPRRRRALEQNDRAAVERAVVSFDRMSRPGSSTVSRPSGLMNFRTLPFPPSLPACGRRRRPARKLPRRTLSRPPPRARTSTLQHASNARRREESEASAKLSANPNDPAALNARSVARMRFGPTAKPTKTPPRRLAQAHGRRLSSQPRLRALETRSNSRGRRGRTRRAQTRRQEFHGPLPLGRFLLRTRRAATQSLCRRPSRTCAARSKSSRDSQRRASIDRRLPLARRRASGRSAVQRLQDARPSDPRVPTSARSSPPTVRPQRGHRKASAKALRRDPQPPRRVAGFGRRLRQAAALGGSPSRPSRN